MRTCFVVAAGCMLLASCAGIKNPLQPQVVYDLENGYGVAQAAAVAYSSLPVCQQASPAPCANHGVVVKLASADKSARTALQDLENFVRNPANYPGLSYSQLLDAAQQAVLVLQEIETQNGVK